MTTVNDPYVMLHKVMADAFDVEDLQAICFELGEDPENIGGDTKVLRCWKMIHFFRQRERLPDLMSRILANRPNLSDEVAAVKNALQHMTPAQAADATLATAARTSEPASAPPTASTGSSDAPSNLGPATSPRDIVHKYARLLAANDLYFVGAIPKDHLENAFAAYAGDAKANGETPLAMLDISVISNGGAGLLLTDKVVYYKESLTNGRFSILLTDIYTVTTKKDIFGKVVILNGNNEIQASSLNDEQWKMMAQMLAECAGVEKQP